METFHYITSYNQLNDIIHLAKKYDLINGKTNNTNSLFGSNIMALIRSLSIRLNHQKEFPKQYFKIVNIKSKMNG